MKKSTQPAPARTPRQRANPAPNIRLSGGREVPLARLGLRNARDMLAFEPLQSARMLVAISKGTIRLPHIERFVKDEYADREPSELASLSITALRGVDKTDAQWFAQAGVQTIADLDQLGKEVEDAIAAATVDNGFSERPSAPVALLPGLIGAIATSVRFTSFVRDTELRRAAFGVIKDCVVDLPISPHLKYPGSVAEIFLSQKCPVIHLGYMCDHRQRWINLGTHLGEVVHSVSLAPGESRNIALVNWRRRQLTALEERTTTSERLTATFVQNRALEEITTAVAREHQSGSTQTEANTAVTAAGLVGGLGVAGGIAGGVTGAVIGGVIGSVAPAVGTTIGAVAGGAVGAVAGGAAGVAAGGLVYAGSQALGMIEADTEGDREIVADVQQRISLSTSQTASAVRSIWSTVVVEDAQAEEIEATTLNITNYNHMHALNIEYYEVLQHYLARIEVERVQPLLFLPFTFFDFTNFRFVRDYWDAVRLHVDDEALRDQGDAYFVTEGEPEVPDLLPVPPMPTPPGEAAALTLKNLRIDVLFKSLPFNTNVGLDVLRGNTEMSGDENENGAPSDDLDGYDWGNRYSFNDIADAQDITAVSLSRNQVLGMDVKYRIRVNRGRLYSGDTQLQNLRGEIIASNRTIAHDDPNQTFSVSWQPAASFESENTQALDEFNRKKAEREAIIAENQRRTAAYEALVESIDRFRERLQRLILRRRHFYTRVILNAIEPEEITQLLEALTIGHDDAGDARIPLSALAHTIPLGMTSGAFVLKLKRLDKDALRELASRTDLDKLSDKLGTLLQYADETLRYFEEAQEKGGLGTTDHIYVPTGGLFAEAILGRANSAEYLDMERYFNWQDSPIPHQPPAIQAVSTESRFQQGEVNVNVPEGNLQVINPVALPDPTGLQGVLTAIQNGNMFRDMSKAAELAGIVGTLSTLAGQMGQAASTMTGQTAQQALQSATEIGKTASAMAQQLMSDAFEQAGGAFSTITNQGAALNKAAQLAQADGGAAGGDGGGSGAGGGTGDGGGGGTGGGGTGGGGTGGGGTGGGGTGGGESSTSEDIVRKAAGLPPKRTTRRARTLNVRLTFESAYGIPLAYDVLASLSKHFRLFHERDIRDIPLGSGQELSNPLYIFPLDRWAQSNGEMAVEIDYGSGSLKTSQTIDIPSSVSTMIVRARIASREQTVTRSSSTSTTQALTELVQQKFGISASAAAKIVQIAEVGIEASGETSSTTTDTDSTTGSTTTTINETLKVPTGALDLQVTFKD